MIVVTDNSFIILKRLLLWLMLYSYYILVLLYISFDQPWLCDISQIINRLEKNGFYHLITVALVLKIPSIVSISEQKCSLKMYKILSIPELCDIIHSLYIINQCLCIPSGTTVLRLYWLILKQLIINNCIYWL